jgi:gliding motility-associated-like protein
MRTFVLCLFLLSIFIAASAQQENRTCAQDQVMRQLFTHNPATKNRHEAIEKRMYDVAKRGAPNRVAENVLTLSVVVHIVHQNGAENISDAQVLKGIQHLNEAYANQSYYHSANGTDTKIQFCLAQRDPNGNLTSGINRVVSRYTNTNGVNDIDEDIALKNTIRWNPTCYINIWLVNSISGPVVGYAYLPSAHGSQVDGIVAEAAYFGSSNSNDVVIIHEMGHYLGLYHTFQNGCSNADCARDGDKVCDTPPDNSTAYLPCGTPMNSCSTDTQSGFSTDQNDQKENYLDYGNWDCMNLFTAGQKDRMRWHVENVRASLLQCYSCQNPCSSPTKANFTSSAHTVIAGTTVSFTNTSSNAATYQWYVNGTLEATTPQFSRVFNQPGQYEVKLIAISSNPAQCASTEKTDVIFVNCPVKASFTPGYNGVVTVGQAITFTNTSTNASAYRWRVNGTSQSTATNFTYTFGNTGTYYISLVADNGICSDSSQVYYYVNVPTTAGFSTFHKYYDVVTNLSAGMYVYDAALDAQGNSVLCGMHNDAAIVASYTPDGNLNWSRELQNGRQSMLTTIKRTADNGFIVAGMYNVACYTCYTPWLVKMDAAGNTQWSKNVVGPTAADYVTDLVQLSDGGYAFTFRANSATVSGPSSNIGIARLTAAGDPLWVKYYDKSVELGGGITETADGIVVSGQYKSPATGIDAILLKVNKANGNFVWAKTYDLEGKDNHFQKVVSLGDKLLVSGYNAIYSTTATDEKLILQTDGDGNILLAQKLKIPGTKADGKGLGVHADGSYTVAINGDGTSTVYAINFSASGAVKVKRKYNDNGFTFINAVMPYAGGIYLAGYRPYDYMSLFKTDANLSTPGCNDEDFTLPLTTATFQVTPVTNTFFNISSGNLGSYDLPVVAGDVPMKEHFSCNDFPVVSTCDSVTFKKTFSGVGAERMYDMTVKSNGHVVTVGAKNIFTTSQTGTSAFLTEISPSGVPVASFAYGGEKVFTHIIPTSDGGYLAAGTNQIWDEVYSSGYPTLTKLDAAYNVQWSKKFAFSGLVRKVLQTQEGNYMVLVDMASTSYLVCVDPAGTILWSKSYQMFSSQFWDMMEDGPFLMATVYPDGILVKIDKRDGSIVWSKEYLYQANNFSFPGPHKIFKSGDSYYLTGGTASGYLLKTDVDGNVQKAVTITVPGTTFFEHLSVLNGPDKTFTLCLRAANYTLTSNDRITLLKMDSNLNVLTALRTVDTKKEFPFSVRPLNASTLYLGGYYYETATNGSQDLLFYKINMTSLANNCSVTPVTPLVSAATIYTRSPSPSPTAVNWTTTNDNQSLTQSVYPFFSILHCFQSPCVPPQTCDTVNCNQLSLSGNQRTCSLSDTVVIRVNRSAACTLPVKWSISPSTGAVVMASSDSLVKVRFLQQGQITVTAKMMSDCSVAQADFTMEALASPGNVNLGPDTTLCTNSIYVLHAGKGYQSYRWQDGSTDSVYTVYLPGNYFVTTTDACGTVYRDTVTITVASPVPFDLGPDKTLCNGETLRISAPPGFTNYTWAPNYRISALTGNSVQLSPLADTIYVVTAVKRGGCLVMDSIRVLVKTSPPVQLGRDTSFCQGQVKQLDAGAGFSQYLWSTGQTTQAISVGAKGRYAVEATASNGCVSKDTVEVLNVYATPRVNLGRDTSLCEGTTLTLRAGSNAYAYAWNNGTTLPQLTVSAAGLYWVNVTDGNGCEARDSLQILAIYRRPSGFLPKDTTICPREQLLLLPAGNFADYTWSDGSSERQATLTHAGTYWLEVTTVDGCTAREYTIVTEKVCKQVLYFPTAFTPNNDGKNDVFKPTAFGTLKHFRLMIFNRWGQQIFQSNDPGRGWDGKIAGQEQATGVYVWQCVYQFQDEPQKNEKGTMALIR